MILYPLKQELFEYEEFSRDEEIECFKKVKNGDKEAREKAILHNLKFAIWAAAQWGEMYYTIEDALYTAVIGLIIAVDKFNIDKRVKFCTYARYWIYRTLKRGKARINLRELSFNICDEAEVEAIQNTLLYLNDSGNNDDIINNISLHGIWNILLKSLKKADRDLIFAKYKNEEVKSFWKLAKTKNFGITKDKTTAQRLYQRQQEIFKKLRENKRLIKLWQEYCNN
jgi:RNA polymerase sigma factor (sigma-70 family)